MNKEELKNKKIRKCNLIGIVVTLIIMVATVLGIYLSNYSYKYYAFIAALFELIIGLIIIAIIKNSIKNEE